MAVVNQIGALGLPAAGFPSRPVGQAITDKGLQSATFTATASFDTTNYYTVPTGGTITLPTPTGSRKQIMFAIYGTGISTLSGTLSVNGVAGTTCPLVGGETLTISDADATQGWC